jgi:hypothetical protein
VGGAVQTPARTPAPTTPQLPGEMTELLTWADEIIAGRVAVFANAESPADVAVAMRLGATGVGLCRSEHWFLGEHRPLLAQLLPGGSDPEHPALLVRFEQVTRLQPPRRCSTRSMERPPPCGCSMRCPPSSGLPVG